MSIIFQNRTIDVVKLKTILLANSLKLEYLEELAVFLNYPTITLTLRFFFFLSFLYRML